MFESDEFLKATGQIAGQVYNDGLQPAIKETGKALALIPQTINAALVPLRKWIVKSEYNFAETQKLLEQKLSQVDAEHIVTPEAYVAIPAMQAISYSMDSKELRNLYANLLARSMIDLEKDKVHPAFIEVIKQLTPNEAKFIDLIKDKFELPLIDVLRYTHGSSFEIDLRNFSLILENMYDNDADHIKYSEMFINNLCRLKIIDIPSWTRMTGNSIYQDLESHHIVTKLLKEKLVNGQYREIYRKKFDITAFGREFINVCVKDL